VNCVFIMTLEELYRKIDGDYAQACQVLRVDKLIDKHIRRFPTGGIVEAVLNAGKTLEPVAMFESAHAMKGVCSNLGLKSLATIASVITEEYRPGSVRNLTDDQIRAQLDNLERLYRKTVDGISEYAAGSV